MGVVSGVVDPASAGRWRRAKQGVMMNFYAPIFHAGATTRDPPQTHSGHEVGFSTSFAADVAFQPREMNVQSGSSNHLAGKPIFRQDTVTTLNLKDQDPKNEEIYSTKSVTFGVETSARKLRCSEDLYWN